MEVKDKKLGRPKKEVVLSGNDRIKKWRQNNREKEREKDRKRKSELKEQKTVEEISDFQEHNRLYMKQYRETKKLNSSCQKIQGMKRKNKKYQQEYYEKSKKAENSDVSTPRVQSYRERQKLIVKMPFNEKRSSRDGGQKRRKIDEVCETVSTLCTPSKRVSVVSKMVKKFTPKSKQELLESIGTKCVTPVPISDLQPLKELSKKRDKISNAARKLIVKGTSQMNPNGRGTLSGMYKRVNSKSVEQILNIARSKRKHKQSHETVKRVQEFYNSDVVSRVVPYKKATIMVKNIDNVKERQCIRVMEMSLLKAYQRYCAENPNVRISRRKFEILRPRNVKTQAHARRMVCGCTMHTNVDFTRNCVKRLTTINKLNTDIFNSNSNLVEYTLCENPTLTCMLRNCENCGTNVLSNFNFKYCSTKCLEEEQDCSEHCVKFLQYEMTDYVYKGEAKRKVALVDKHMVIPDIVEHLKVQLIKFSVHRFNVEHTKDQMEFLLAHLKEDEIIKIQDFSENYKCLLPNEIQSMHWVQQSTTIFPAVVIRNVDGKLREEHLIFISNDLKHDVAFVEVVNELIHEHYNENKIPISRDFEFNDGCASQFKSKTAIGLLTKRKILTSRVWYESSHGKNPSDGAGGQVKGVLSHAVTAGQIVMRDAKEVFEFCQQNLTVENGEKKMLTRKFFFVTEEELEEMRHRISEINFPRIKDTLKLHQVATTGDENSILLRNFACFCEPCYDGHPNNCLIINDETYPAYTVFDEKSKNQVTYIKHYLQKNLESVNDEVTDNDVINDEETDNDDIEDTDTNYQLSSSVNMVSAGSNVVVRANDDYSSYYLIKVISPPFILDTDSKDGYGHWFHQNTEVITGHYYEIYGNRDDGTYFLDTTKTCFVSTFCIAGICPELEVKPGKRRRKDVDVYFVSPDIDEALMEICTTSVIY